jgi:hypothetical protein
VGYARARQFEVERPYPGPGFARYLVARAQGQGRTLTLTATARFLANPGQPVVVTVPDTPTQVGTLAAARWNLRTCDVDLRTRDLADTPPEAWALVNPALTWAAVPSTKTWATWKNPNGV